MFEPGLIVTIAMGFIGAIVWAVRVEGRVNGHDDAFTNMNKLLDERDEHNKERHQELAGRLERIEVKIDRGFKNGHSKELA
jgi:hypothetical protein